MNRESQKGKPTSPDRYREPIVLSIFSVLELRRTEKINMASLLISIGLEFPLTSLMGDFHSRWSESLFLR